MTRLLDNDLTLSTTKCQFNVDRIWFYGYPLSQEGILADKAKIAELVNVKEPIIHQSFFDQQHVVNDSLGIYQH